MSPPARWRKTTYDVRMRESTEFRQSAEALRRFEQWERDHPAVLDARVALAGIGWIWQLLPEESRRRPLDVSGIDRMRRTLAVLR